MDQDYGLLDDFDFESKDLFYDAQDASWDKLVNQIVKGNVIPLIGPDILIDGANIHRKLVDALAKMYKLQSNPTSFSEIVYDHDFLKQVNDDKESIYNILNKFSSRLKAFRPSGLLRELLSIKQFPFVMVTSFTPIAEEVMKEVWGDELKVMKFNNNPQENDDILSDVDLRKPTIYYMFGKVGDRATGYVLTDTDMLDFCTSWLTEGRPENLVRHIKDKYLLMLGNNYSDWLFRFIWYSIRKSGQGEGLVVSENIDDELSQFLERNHVFICNNPHEVVHEIKTRLQVKLIDNERSKFNSVEKGVDVFISYSRRDIDIAQELYDRLSAQGKRVWFDKNNISTSGDYRKEIEQGIQKARYFIPILSRNVEREVNESHYYRLEWKYAAHMANTTGRKYIIPIVEDGFCYPNASVDDAIERLNAIIYTGKSDIETVAQQIIHLINQE